MDQMQKYSSVFLLECNDAIAPVSGGVARTLRRFVARLSVREWAVTRNIAVSFSSISFMF